jgi:hypothetical protein
MFQLLKGLTLEEEVAGSPHERKSWLFRTVKATSLRNYNEPEQESAMSSYQQAAAAANAAAGTLDTKVVQEHRA